MCPRKMASGAKRQLSRTSCAVGRGRVPVRVACHMHSFDRNRHWIVSKNVV